MCDGLRPFGSLGCALLFQVHGIRYLSIQSVHLFSRKVCYAVSEIRLAHEGSDYGDGVDHAED